MSDNNPKRSYHKPNGEYWEDLLGSTAISRQINQPMEDWGVITNHSTGKLNLIVRLIDGTEMTFDKSGKSTNLQ